MGGTAPADDAGSRGGVPPAGSGGSAATGGSPPTGDASDGDADGAPPGRPIPTPGIVVCGDTTCDVTASSGNACCVRNALFASKCESALTGCALNGGQTFNCDDTSDCPGGQICCSFTLNTVTTTRCEASCEGFGSPTQLCRTDAQCGPKKCVVSEYYAEYGVCQ